MSKNYLGFDKRDYKNILSDVIENETEEDEDILISKNREKKQLFNDIAMECYFSIKDECRDLNVDLFDKNFKAYDMSRFLIRYSKMFKEIDNWTEPIEKEVQIEKSINFNINIRK